MRNVSLAFALLACASLACGAVSQAETEVAQTHVAQTQNAPTPADTVASAPTSTAEPQATEAPTDTAEPDAKAAGVGDRVEVSGTALTVAKISFVKKSGISTAKDGNVFLVAEVLIENTGSDPAAYNPLYFRVKDTDGFEYNSTFSAPQPSLKSGELAAGEKARGNVAFEVPEGAKGLVLNYRPIVLLSAVDIKVSLGDAQSP